jgi:hypothetical protein
MNLPFSVPLLTLCLWIWFTGEQTAGALNTAISTTLMALFTKEVLSEAS